MTNGAIENDFLVDLLTLQQDGKQSISAPSNWISQVPLLEVSTQIDEIVKDIGNVMLAAGNSESVARWHFFIGSPGNGKSAAIGKLCRYLHKMRECSIVDENNNDIVDLDPLLVPYALYVYEKDMNYASALIVQDASVVRNPFSPDVDPATDLIETLQQAWSKGVSLIVCTNRGVVEKAYRDISTNNNLNKAPWFKILRSIAESDLMVNKELIEEMNFEDNKTAFKKVNITCSHLDNMSLLIGSNIFNNLIQKAVDPERWICCEECSVKELCPYKTNQEWLFDEDGRKSFLKILQRAEVYSGQIIVFREAVAIISLILAGCPKDYINGHPCEWVRTSANAGEFFLLATRRIYMTLFSSYAPYGLEQSQMLQKKQVNSFEWLCQEMPGSQTKVKNSLNPIINGSPLSTDVGVTRLLGEEGIIAQIDPVRDSLPYEFYNLWDSEYDYIIGHANPMLTDIELQCLKIWASLEQSIEYFSGYIVSDVHWALRRWSSNYLMHLGLLSLYLQTR